MRQVRRQSAYLRRPLDWIGRPDTEARMILLVNLLMFAGIVLIPLVLAVLFMKLRRRFSYFSYPPDPPKGRPPPRDIAAWCPAAHRGCAGRH